MKCNKGPNLTLLFLIFLVVKLVGYATFSWWVVWSPILVSFVNINSGKKVLVIRVKDE